jgi:hypothetical protein
MGSSLIIHGHYRRPTGYGCHVREIVRALDKLGIRVQLVDLPTGGFGALPKEKRDSWFEYIGPPCQLRCDPAYLFAASGEDC